ncbi:type IV pilus modification PilV family protein [Moritella viscosa]|uniref:Mannose-sensitive agglutinin (MSHA) biogenesis proteinMshD (Pilus type IV) n=1 Tax=Moritella viscosa TaxID=80854 RepID=A0ABY1HH82_9GAMM|nr:prepilin-type N-terminal cleavage/methylation domain-containing protein [Moritella viscosa]SGY92329.1 Putative Mannose-sensitive agglutinin (MSHA) biogenesis proteinMshD (Pilus type IV) [Moritella viscosa]SGY97234.1 Putative Mannose-sensitive agglutinin (MSHA) biogenesis proteinMshD (Pilus type IV) [Moritella viscosa]SGZ03027.1 Putative Mannose-sensitive agglutinin (MSHA) biogenesis proteinMshD (Pilus type IV) [Moritella viscosa]SHO26453.1 Putative Mannose-sensitive agglutinin (MSHA) biogene
MKTNSTPRPLKTRNQRGFTLIEIVVGMVVLAISLVIVTGIFLPQANNTVTPMYQIKATALGKRIMDQVLIRYYDETSTSSGGFIRCGEQNSDGVVLFPCSSDLGTDGSEVSSAPGNFNDVDDYNIYCGNSDPGAALASFTNEYPGYGLRICVSFAADKFNSNLTSDVTDIAKRIRVTISMPNDEAIELTSFKGNY